MEENTVIDAAFKKEVGIDMHEAITILNRRRISPEELTEITIKLKNTVSDEIETRGIPVQYRFLMLNVIFCTLFKTAIKFHKEFIIDTEKNNIDSDM